MKSLPWLVLLPALTLSIQAATTINTANKYACGANLGWINFQSAGAPRVDLSTGKLSGCVWSANCGWISLSNAVAYVQTDSVQQGTLAPDGLPIAWLLAKFGSTSINANADPDGDGMSNLQEYLAGRNPNDTNSVLRITSITRGTASATDTTLLWLAQPTRFYAAQYRPSLASGLWVDFVALAAPGANSVSFIDPDPTREYYRIRAFRPLMP